MNIKRRHKINSFKKIYFAVCRPIKLFHCEKQEDGSLVAKEYVINISINQPYIRLEKPLLHGQTITANYTFNPSYRHLDGKKK